MTIATCGRSFVPWKPWRRQPPCPSARARRSWCRGPSAGLDPIFVRHDGEILGAVVGLNNQHGVRLPISVPQLHDNSSSRSSVTCRCPVRALSPDICARAATAATTPRRQSSPWVHTSTTSRTPANGDPRTRPRPRDRPRTGQHLTGRAQFDHRVAGQNTNVRQHDGNRLASIPVLTRHAAATNIGHRHARALTDLNEMHDRTLTIQPHNESGAARRVEACNRRRIGIGSSTRRTSPAAVVPRLSPLLSSRL
jgi:hypothetical protein